MDAFGGGIVNWTGRGHCFWFLSHWTLYTRSVVRPPPTSSIVSLSFCTSVWQKEGKSRGALMLIIITTIYIIPPTPAPLAFNWPCGSATEDVNTCCHPLYVTKRQTVRHQWMGRDVYSNFRGIALHNTVQAGLLKQQNDRHRRRIEELSRKYLIK